MSQDEKHASGEQRPDAQAASVYRRDIIGPCRCSHDVAWSICEESGNFLQRIRARFFNYLRRVAS